MDKNIVRNRCSQVGWILLIYYLVMSAAVSLVDVIAPSPGVYAGWGYILAIIVTFVVLLHWPYPKIAFSDIWKENRSIRSSHWVLMLCSVSLCQVLFQILSFFWEMAFGTNAVDNMFYANAMHHNFPMLIYVGIAAPVFEEILFRGFVMRVLRPYGKCFAIITTAFLFGIFHGHILQSPFAFAMGLVLGYMAVEFSLKRAIMLHMFNNLILVIGFAYLSDWIGSEVSDWVYALLIYGSALTAVTIMLCRCSALVKYWKESDRQQNSLRYFITAPGVLLLIGLMGLCIVLSTFSK